MKFKNIIFDLGGVIVDLKTRESLSLFAQMGMPIPESMQNTKTFNAMPKGNELLELIHRVDLGEVLQDEFVQIILSKCHSGVSAQQIIDAFCNLIVMPRHRLELLLELRKKYKLYLLSNIGDMHWNAACDASKACGINLEDCFDETFLSYKLHLAKPDPKIFDYVIKKTGINPSETLYIDDFEDNIVAGNKAGLISYKIESNSLNEHVNKLFNI